MARCVRRIVAVLFLVSCAAIDQPAHADEIVAPPSLRQSSGVARFIYRLDRPATGSGFLNILWSDGLGRIVDQRRISVRLSGDAQIPFDLDLRRAVTLRNNLDAHLALSRIARDGRKHRRFSESAIAFTATPSRDPWSDYNAIIWQPVKSEQCAALRELGITAGAVIAPDRDDPASALDAQISTLLGCNLGWYVENIATDFYAPYHRWSPDHAVNWRFVEAKKAYQKNPRDPAALMREPSLSDPLWLERIRARLRKTVAIHRAYRPLYYSLADEAGIADLSVLWDFDFAKPSLQGMRRWLRGRYASLGALNRQWGSAFASWDAVMPMTTADAMRRTDENYSAWADFKAWMDVAFARALASGTEAVHAGDGKARAALEGGQIPGWGGYDYSQLVRAVDVMELYDGGGNIELARALNPAMVLLTTSMGGPAEAAHLWRELLRGSRGVILWDPKQEIVAADGQIGARGRALAPALSDIRSGLGALLAQSQRVTAPVALLYSPASMRTQWMLDWRAKGDAWSARDADSDYEDDSAVRTSMVDFFDLMEHDGIEPQILTPDRLENGALRRSAIRVLILPRTLSLSRQEADAIRGFVANGGMVIADGAPGAFDQHSRRWPQPILAPLFDQAHAMDQGLHFGKGRIVRFDSHDDAQEAAATAAQSSDRARAFAALLTESGAAPPISLREASVPNDAPHDIEVNQWRNGGVTIIALQRDLPDEAGHDRDEKLVLTLPHRAFLYDLRGKEALGFTDRVSLFVSAGAPSMLAVSTARRAPPRLVGPRQLSLGGVARFDIIAPKNERATTPVVHLSLIDPDGVAVAEASANFALHHGKASATIPFAQNAKPGRWQVQVTDLLGGGTALWPLDLSKPDR